MEMRIGETEMDVIDTIRAKQKLNASQVTYVLELLVGACGVNVALIDPGFIPIYMRSNETKPRTTMARYFTGDRQRPITVIPIHDNDHWSLLLYVSRFCTFYYFDSLDEYHEAYVTRVITKMVTDGIIVDTTQTQLVSIESEGQRSTYECGQYLFMFLYAFFTQYKAYGVSHTEMDRSLFTGGLQSYVRESCCELHRQKFIRLVIAWIHESRGY